MQITTSGYYIYGRLLGRLGLALVLLFVVNTLFGLLPLELLDPAWQLRVADLLRTTAPFTLLGAALIFLCELVGGVSPSWLPLQLIQRLAPMAALGFLLLIPLQIHASWSQIRTADAEAQKTIRSVERRIATVRSVASSADLVQLSRGLPADWQPLPEESLAVNRARLLGRAEPELARLRNTASSNKSAAIQKRLRDGLRDALLCLIYAVAFIGLRPRRFAEPSLAHVGFDDSDPHAAEEFLPTDGNAARISNHSPVPPESAQMAADSSDSAPASGMDQSSPDQDEPDLSQADRHPWYP